MISDTSMLVEKGSKNPVNPDSPEKPDINPGSDEGIKDAIVKGSYIELSVNDGSGTHVDRYTVRDGPTGGKLTVDYERDSVKNTIVMTEDQFLGLLDPVLGGAVKDSTGISNKVDTPYKVTCNVYTVKIPMASDGTVKYMDRQMWIDSNGVMFKIHDKMSDWDYTATLKDTNMLTSGYKK